MDYPLYLLARVVIFLLQSMPLDAVARLGRAGGFLAYHLDRRHRTVATENLQATIGTGLAESEVRGLALENFKRIGESFACAIKTAGMTEPDLKGIYEVIGAEQLTHLPNAGPSTSAKWVVAIGHFGNFELYARLVHSFPGLRGITTYRGLPGPLLDRLLQKLRAGSGCLFLERRTGAAALKEAMSRPGVVLGLLCDQHAGDHGLRLPFLGRECSTSSAPAVFARRYECRLITAICQRTALARWRFMIGPEIPTHLNGQLRTPEDLMQDVNRVFESEIRRDPANWFWVHRRWKPRPRPRSGGRPTGPALPAAQTAGTNQSPANDPPQT